jgi:hypothetical protein
MMSLSPLPMKHVRDLIASSYKKVTDMKKKGSLSATRSQPYSLRCGAAAPIFSILTFTL